MLDMGVAGAAVATVISQAVSFLWVVRFLTGKQAVMPNRTHCFARAKAKSRMNKNGKMSDRSWNW